MTFETEVDAIILELETRLKEITRLEGRVIRAFPQAVNDWPTVWLHLERVEIEIEAEGVMVSVPLIEHVLVFSMVFQDRWDEDETPELNEDIKISRLGEVLDKVREYTTNYPKWDLMWYPIIEYSQITRRANYVALDANVELRVRKKW